VFRAGKHSYSPAVSSFGLEEVSKPEEEKKKDVSAPGVKK